MKKLKELFGKFSGKEFQICGYYRISYCYCFCGERVARVGGQQRASSHGNNRGTDGRSRLLAGILE